MERNRLIATSKASFSVVVWGASFIATKVALREVSPVTVVWLRFAIGFAVLGAVVIARKQFSIPHGRELGYLILLGFIGISFHQWLQSTGLVTAQASTTAWIVGTTPIFIALLGWLVLKEELGWGRVAGIALAAAGVLLVVSKGDLTSLAGGKFGSPGDILILISAPNWAIFSVLSRRGLQQNSPARMMFYVMGIGWSFTSIHFFLGPGIGEIGQLTSTGWLGVWFLGLFCSGLAYIFWYDALQIIPASQVGVLLYLEPVVAVVVAAALLGEPVLFASLLGGGLILLGVWVVTRAA